MGNSNGKTGSVSSFGGHASAESTARGSALARGESQLCIRRGALLEWCERTGLGRTALLAMIDHFFSYATPVAETDNSIENSEERKHVKCVDTSCVSQLFGLGIRHHLNPDEEDTGTVLQGKLPGIFVTALEVCEALRDSSSLSKNAPLPFLDQLQEEIAFRSQEEEDEQWNSNGDQTSSPSSLPRPSLEQYLLFLSLNLSFNQSDHMLVLSALVFGTTKLAFDDTALPEHIFVYVAPNSMEKIQTAIRTIHGILRVCTPMSEAKRENDMEVYSSQQSIHSSDGVLWPVLPVGIVRSRIVHLIRNLPPSLGNKDYHQGDGILESFDQSFPQYMTTLDSALEHSEDLLLRGTTMNYEHVHSFFISRSAFVNWARQHLLCKNIFGLRQHVCRFCQKCATIRARAQDDIENNGTPSDQPDETKAESTSNKKKSAAAKIAEQSWKTAYCSYCFQLSFHSLVELGVVNRDIMSCENCGKLNQQCFFCSARTRFNKMRCAVHHNDSRPEFDIQEWGQVPRVLKSLVGHCSFCGEYGKHTMVPHCTLFSNGIDLYRCGFCSRFIHRCLRCLKCFAPVKSRYHLEDCIWCTSEATYHCRDDNSYMCSTGNKSINTEKIDSPAADALWGSEALFSAVATETSEDFIPGSCLYTGFAAYPADQVSSADWGFEEYSNLRNISPSPARCHELYCQVEYQYRRAQYMRLLEEDNHSKCLLVEGNHCQEESRDVIVGDSTSLPPFEEIWLRFNVDKHSGDSRVHNPFLPCQPWCPFSPTFPMVDGEAYFDFVADLFRKARYDIFISGWFLSDFIWLRRNPLRERLDCLLTSKAAEGVHVYILLWSEVSFVKEDIYPGSEFNKRMRRYHENIHVIAHPELTHFAGNTPADSIKWTHHQKYCVVDQRVAMVGGIDLLVGRWDNWTHRLFDEHRETWLGLDYKSPYNQATEDCVYEPFQDVVDRSRYPRQPHHDVSMLFSGRAGFDVARSFILRWNHHRKLHHPKLRLRSVPELNDIERQRKIGSFRVCIQEGKDRETTWAIHPPVALSLARDLFRPTNSSSPSILLPRKYFFTVNTQLRTEDIVTTSEQQSLLATIRNGEDNTLDALSEPVACSENMSNKRAIENEPHKRSIADSTFVAGSGHATEFPRDNRQLKTATASGGDNAKNLKDCVPICGSSNDQENRNDGARTSKNRVAGFFRFSVAWARLRRRRRQRNHAENVKSESRTPSPNVETEPPTSPQKLAYSAATEASDRAVVSCFEDSTDTSVPELVQRVVSVLSTSGETSGKSDQETTSLITASNLEAHGKQRAESDITSTETVSIRLPTAPYARANVQEVEVPRNAPGASAMTNNDGTMSMQREDSVEQHETATDKDALYTSMLSKLPRAAARMLTSWGHWSGSVAKRQELYGEHLRLIDTAEYYVYIENQYMVSSLCAGIRNRIFLALWQRLRRAIKLQETFRVILVLPFPEEEGGKWRTIVNHEHRTLWRGRYSLFGRLREEFPQVDLNDYLCFLMARTYQFTQNLLQSDQVFIHSKVMIVDDRSAIVSSANINDRSLLGDRDSEMGCIISSEVLVPGNPCPLAGIDPQSRHDICESTMDGKVYWVTRAVQMLRLRLWREFLGFACDSDSVTESLYFLDSQSKCPDSMESDAVKEANRILNDPVASSVYHSILINTAKTNARILEHVFSDTPRDDYKTQNDLEQGYNEQPYPMDGHLLAGIRGYFVWAPIFYLEEESMSLRVTDKEFYITTETLC